MIIQKEQGDSKIHKIRVICIFEADYSAMLGIVWRNLARSSEKQNTINNGQVGGRAGKDANTITFMEEIKYDITKCSRKPL
eukprot:2033610-Ditylum_brightwellii.AAC.1